MLTNTFRNENIYRQQNPVVQILQSEDLTLHASHWDNVEEKILHVAHISRNGKQSKYTGWVSPSNLEKRVQKSELQSIFKDIQTVKNIF